MPPTPCAVEAHSCGTELTPPAKPLRVLLASANERDGGAAVAAGRLRDGLLQAGTDARMFVQTPGPRHPATLAPMGAWQRTLARARSGVDALPLRRYPARHAPFSVNWLPRFQPGWPHEVSPDLIHLHWIHAGFMSLTDLRRLKVPLVWTVHDMWALTGGCHYDEECGRHATGCGRCPILHSADPSDLSARRWQARRQAYAPLDLTVISPSRWLGDLVRNSPLFEGKRVEVIANGIDLQAFKPLDRAFARHALGLPAEGRVLLFGAVNAGTDPRKGHDLLQAAMGHLAQRFGPDDLVLAVFGSTPARRETSFGFRTWHFGHLGDELSLALLYAAADVFVAPSRQDNLPNTLVEAMACGTPCVAFDIGGMPDLIRHRYNGYLAAPFDAQDLAAGLAWALSSADDQPRRLADAARRFACEHFDLALQTRRHLQLYRELLTARLGAQRD